MAFSRPVSVVATLVVAAALSAVAVAVVTDDHHPATARPGTAADQLATTAPTTAPVDVSLSDCGSAWTAGPAGEQEITLHNADSRSGEVRVVGVGAGIRRQVFAQLEPFGPGTTVTMHVRLAAGQYALQCLFAEQSPVDGPAVAITGDGAGVRGVVPVTTNRLVSATLRYTRWVLGQLPRLEAETRSLQHAVDGGNPAAAKGWWLRAHAHYERLGAAYDAFGDLDGAINGLPAGLPKGVHDQDFTGFHRVELSLWHPGTSTTAQSRRQAGRLADSVDALEQQLSSTQLDPLTMSIRAHEITENLLQFALSGSDDLGSHSTLATIGAGLDGTHQVLDMLKGQLKTRYPHLERLYRELAHARHLVGALARGPLGHEAVASWPTGQRERVDAAISELSERLAPVASVLEPRRTS